jgi:hypothetical protein
MEQKDKKARFELNLLYIEVFNVYRPESTEGEGQETRH